MIKEKVYTFWEGEMPEYIKLCMKTWKFDYVLLNYYNLNQYTDLKADDRLKRFSLPKIADVVRVHVLRDNGGYWLDTDTIMLKDELPEENMIGYPAERGNTIGFLHTEPHTDMYERWASHQDCVIRTTLLDQHTRWDVMGNAFTDDYLPRHPEITIADVTNRWPETYMFMESQYHVSRRFKYEKFYFDASYNLSDLRPTNMLMLHNSWTPNDYKMLSEEEVLKRDCTLSNILREVL